jgi:hypothetical protein
VAGCNVHVINNVIAKFFLLVVHCHLEVLKVLDATDQLHFQELIDYLQTYLIENKDQWTE